MLRLVKPMKLGEIEDEIVQQVFDRVVHSDVERLAKQIKGFAYGVTLAQLIGDRIRVASPERVKEMKRKLRRSGLIIQYNYSNHRPLLFHRDNVERETLTRRVYQLNAA